MGLVVKCMMLAENKTIGRNRKGMKVKYEFYRKYGIMDLLPCITLLWDCGLYCVDLSWLRWGIYIEFYRGNVACR